MVNDMKTFMEIMYEIEKNANKVLRTRIEELEKQLGEAKNVVATIDINVKDELRRDVTLPLAVYTGIDDLDIKVEEVLHFNGRYYEIKVNDKVAHHYVATKEEVRTLVAELVDFKKKYDLMKPKLKGEDLIFTLADKKREL